MLQSYRLLGTKITPATWATQESAICEAVDNKQTFVIGSQNGHGIYTYLTDDKFRELHNDPRTFVHIDGMPVVWLGKLCGLPFERCHRTAWTDHMHPLLQLAERNSWRVYYVAGEIEVFRRSLLSLRRFYPSLDIQGHPGYFDAATESADNQEILRAVRAFDPHVVIVGMGMGRQEGWVRDNLDQLGTRVVITCGACIDYLADVETPVPRWIGRIGLEWLFRLLKHPNQMWKRYLLEPWIIVWIVLRNRPSQQNVSQ